MHSFVKFLFSSDSKTKPLEDTATVKFWEQYSYQIMCANETQHFNFNLWLIADLLGLSLFAQRKKKNNKSCKVLQDYPSLFQFCLHVSFITFAFI